MIHSRRARAVGAHPQQQQARHQRRSGPPCSCASPPWATADAPPSPASPAHEPATHEPSPSGRSADALGALRARLPEGARIARFRAEKRAEIVVAEREKPLSAYMSLPASQYSVLDARKIERLGDDRFRCHVGRLSFLGFAVEPVLTVSVETGPRGCTIALLGCELKGSPAVERAGGQFEAAMANRVTWRAMGGGGRGAAEGAAAAGAADGGAAAGAADGGAAAAAAAAPTAQPNDDGASPPPSDPPASPSPPSAAILSDVAVEVAVAVPRWLAVPVSGVEAAGSSVMRGTLALMVPRFLAQLARDYGAWASGDASRQALGDGAL